MAVKEAIWETGTSLKLNTVQQIYDNICILQLEIHLHAIQDWKQCYYI